MVRAFCRVVAVPALPPMESDEVATSTSAVPAAFEYNMRLPVMEERPVPPFATVRALARVRAPVEEKLEVAVDPKYA